MSQAPETGEARLLRPRLRGIEDSYGLVLIAIMATLILMGMLSGKPWGDTVILVAFLVCSSSPCRPPPRRRGPSGGWPR